MSQIITLTIPDEKVVVALEGFLYIYPNNETIPDPEWDEFGAWLHQVFKRRQMQKIK